MTATGVTTTALMALRSLAGGGLAAADADAPGGVEPLLPGWTDAASFWHAHQSPAGALEDARSLLPGLGVIGACALRDVRPAGDDGRLLARQARLLAVCPVDAPRRLARLAAARYRVPLVGDERELQAAARAARPDAPVEYPPSRAPAGALAGVRAFGLSAAGALISTVMPAVWLPGDNAAVCAAGQHSSPSPLPDDGAHAAGCHCGLNAYHDLGAYLAGRADPPAAIGPPRPAVLAAVAGWGAVEVHRSGWRVSHAKVVAVGLRGDTRDAARRACAARYGVPAVAEQALDAFASEHARRVRDRDLPR